MSLTEEQIKQIADSIETDLVCFLNIETGEIEEILSNDVLEHYDIYGDDIGEDEEKYAEPGWQKEMRMNVKAQIEKINSWKSVIKIEKPPTHEYFKFMESFVEEIVPEGLLKEQFLRALNNKKPFAHFKNMLHNSKYLKDWGAFKQKMMMNWVGKELGL